MIAGTCVSGASTRRGTKTSEAAAATNKIRSANTKPNAELSEPNHENGFSAATNESPLARAACSATTRYSDTIAPIHERRKNR